MPLESDSEEEEERLQYKVILLGDGAVGKTSIAHRFSGDSYDRSYKQTIGLDFFIKQVELPGGVSVAVQLWDIGGQSIGGKMIKNYIYGAHAVLLCYDISNYQSFQNLEDWLRLVQETFKGGDMPYLGLLANKADLTHLRTVKPHKHNTFADNHSMYSYFMSAKTGDNVSSTFYRIAADLAGVKLSRTEMEMKAKNVTAVIVNHKEDKTGVAPGKPKKSCAIM